MHTSQIFKHIMNYLGPRDIKSGDVLLCYAPELKGKREEVLSGYSHAAICLGDCRLLEAQNPQVHETSVESLLNDYAHIAVLRSEGFWSPDRISRLWKFAADNIGKSFNGIGAGKVGMRRAELIETADDRVRAYFATGETIDPNRSVYFCSELVTAALIRVGIIHKSAAPLFDPQAFSPQDIGKDGAFGLFIGYIKSSCDYAVPETDIFWNSLL
jgi:hypothetical protein